jgi:DNA-binding LacI/PurR family transcriptional regulator
MRPASFGRDINYVDLRITPDAVFCSNDYMAAGAMKVLAESKLRVPEDVAIVGSTLIFVSASRQP